VSTKLGGLKGKVIGVLGLAFKENTDDMRDAPAVDIIQALAGEGARVRAYDPVAMDNARLLLPDVELVADPYELAKGCDALVVVTPWNEFKNFDFKRLKSLMRSPVVFDGRNIYNPAEMAELGFEYHGVGRASGGK
jgi:UDPglucose 6-dehydrogenase